MLAEPLLLRRSQLRPRAAGLLLLASVACATTSGPSGRPAGHAEVEPTPEEAMMLADLVQHRTNRTSHLRAALIVGGARDARELDELAAALDRRLNGIVAQLPGGPPTERGRALLGALFSPALGPPLLMAYEAGATTVYDIVTRGRFNCVSATTLYLLAAERAGIDARPVLLPSHARAVVPAGRRQLVVETTTPAGFNPPAALLQQARDRARPKRAAGKVDLYADERGTEVDWNALIAVTYGNLAIQAQDRRDDALASALLAREAALVPPAQAAVVRGQQAALLSELGVRALEAKQFEAAMNLARRAADAASDLSTRQMMEQNITAVASRQLQDTGREMSDAALNGFAEPLRPYPLAYGDVQALVLTAIGQRLLAKGDINGSAAAWREAATFASSNSLRGVTNDNARIGELNRIGAQSQGDPEAAWAALQALGPADAALQEQQADVTRVVLENRAVRYAKSGECERMEQMLSDAPSIARGPLLRASCHATAGHLQFERGESAAAIVHLRLAVQLQPDDPIYRHNLAVMIGREVEQLVNGNHCDQAGPLIREGQKLELNNTFFAQAASVCTQR